MKVNNQEVKKKIDPIDIWARAKRLGKNQKYFAGVHKATIQQVSQALKMNTRQPGLLRRIAKHVEVLEGKQ